ncbi:thiamine pyrophosphate-dependent enzyme [Sinisalibacter lacisalsi]|uniref:Pyruvate oxidase n=1 Tax=Sinisalibacter lacisalsi TaxID=1526570 RepID=A0ABQ1QLI2_9RHOB|nr:thiamine pyrophosphate-dependent enzyme [Sinisalibacter lacisalsi]GGD29877.1 pyruvate oxidase [Sinisalibacter lacisalsi]
MARDLRTDPTSPARPVTAVIAASLARAGVRRVYTVPGDMAYGILRACDAAGLGVFSLRSQATAVFASAADNLASGRLASAVLVTRGPALANTLSALSSVVAHGTPVFLLAPCESPEDARDGAFQGAIPLPLDGDAPFETLRLAQPEDLAEKIEQALARATGPGRRSTVALVERALLSSTAGPSCGQVARLSDDRAGVAQTADLKAAAAILGAAENPVIVVGHRARWSARETVLAELATRLNAPLCPTGLSIGFGGGALASVRQDQVHRTLAAADAVVLVGAALDWTLRFGAAVGDSARVIALRDRGDHPAEKRAPEIILKGEIGENLEALLAHLAQRTGRAMDGTGPVHPAIIRPDAGAHRPLFERIVTALADDFPAGAGLVLDGSSALIHAARIITPTVPWARITPGIMGHLGSGIGHALGAWAGGRFGRVFLLSGDFSLGLALADLESLVRYKAPVTLLVCNNNGLASENNQLRGGDERIARYSAATDYARVMDGLGGAGHRVENLEAWDAIRPRALAGDGPCLIDIADRDGLPA